jgi:hypothetical protein
VALLAVTALPAVAAYADQDLGTKGGTTYVSGQRTIVTGESKTIGARCPSGTHVIGGGFGSDTRKLVARSSRPIDGPDADRRHDDGWSVELRASAPDQGVAYATCGKVGGRHERAETVAAPAHGGTTVRVRCPRGTHVLAGGGASATLALIASFPFDSADHGYAPDDGWRIRARTKNVASARLWAYATCSKRPPQYVERRRTLLSGLPTAVSARCRDKRSVVGLGGSISSSAASSKLRSISPLPGRPGGVPAAGVSVQAQSTGGVPHALIAFAICL